MADLAKTIERAIKICLDAKPKCADEIEDAIVAQMGLSASDILDKPLVEFIEKLTARDVLHLASMIELATNDEHARQDESEI